MIASVLASKASNRVGVPTLLVFIAIGMLVGSEGLGGIAFDDARLAQGLGVIALAYILFSGGLDTDWREIRPVLGAGLALATVGVLATCALVGVFVHYALGLDWRTGLLIGAIVSSTDAAAVFSVLRGRGVHLRGRLPGLLELESGSNDPMAVFLTTAMIALIAGAWPTGPAALGTLALHFVREMLVGAVVGWAAGKSTVYLLNRIRLESEGLYPVLTLALVPFVYAATQRLGGNGFLAVYAAGLSLGRHAVIHKRSLTQFHDGIAWLVQIGMFLTLGLLVYPSRLVSVAGAGLALSAFLVFVARPVAVAVALARTRFTRAEKALVAWVGLRGAVPIVLATFPLTAGTPQAEAIFNLVFFVVLTSVALQGSLLPSVARRLGVEAAATPKVRYPIEYVPQAPGATALKSELRELHVQAGSHAAGRSVVELGLPETVLIVLMQRDGQMLVPRGTTRVEAGDTMLLLADETGVSRVSELVHTS